MTRPVGRDRVLAWSAGFMLCMGPFFIPHAGAAPPPDAARIDAWQQVILARPLFSHSRRPDATPDQSAPRPRLAGIVVSGGRRRAIFMTREDGPGQVVDAGMTVGPWQVVAIGAGTVRVRGADGEQTLRPDRDRSADTPAPGDASSIDNSSGLPRTEERIPGNTQ
ncbi:general secretion pathway protein GspN [Gluconacetobacter diazotrophicus]|uniref:General secretion pathway protein GspN n=1 Tax=Gluconacetobacter diazotrophicus TaxID=33996 RepID=A0A7W4I3J7_GLUDI|nr:general secretion pathway protein GspN [Gluconacetobacter diazotrophicus]MBB2154999.1 general secretion pathway protein GspN [Gluconacetobacter diazotrophicus]